MNADDALRRFTEVVRRRHLALATERTYCAWLRRYCDFLKGLPFHLPSEQKLERFLTVLAQKNVAASTQNQAFNAIIFFYKEALGTELKNVQSLRARRPAHLRHAPTPKETWQLIKTIQSDALFATNLVVRLLYGCGLRVCEPLNLRIKDVNLEAAQLTIRAAKGGKDRVVAIPCSALGDLREQIQAARAVWHRDQQNLPANGIGNGEASEPVAMFNTSLTTPGPETASDQGRGGGGGVRQTGHWKPYLHLLNFLESEFGTKWLPLSSCISDLLRGG